MRLILFANQTNTDHAVFSSRRCFSLASSRERLVKRAPNARSTRAA
jgi:hypothetical protein